MPETVGPGSRVSRKLGDVGAGRGKQGRPKSRQPGGQQAACRSGTGDLKWRL
jgi:hypothetical protein